MPADLDCKLFGFPEPKWEWFDLGINTGSKLTIGDPKDGKPLKKCDNKKVKSSKSLKSLKFKLCTHLNHRIKQVIPENRPRHKI